MTQTSAYIYDAVRTPRGKARPDGGLHALTPFYLLSALYQALEQRTGLDPSRIDDVILGCATQVGEQAANIAKTSALYHGWPSQVPGITLNRYCSSGVDAINFAAMKVMTGMSHWVVAGGVEMMSRVGMLSDQPVAFTDNNLAKTLGMYMMGNGADFVATAQQVSRQQADAVALMSQQRAAYARKHGFFKSIIAIDNPVTGQRVEHDEIIRDKTTSESLAAMLPSFTQAPWADEAQLAELNSYDAITHIHTAGNSPAMADGASALLIGSLEAGDLLNIKPRARIRAMINVNDDNRAVVAGCVAATKALLRQEDLNVEQVDLFEIHEAFAAVMVQCQRDLNIPHTKLNVNGGCIALGHPLGATGGIMTGTLLDELERRQLKTGIVATSGAAGAGTALLIERLS